MIYGLIFSAGNQKRFELETPKALIPLGSKPLLKHNIEHLYSYCNRIFVVCSDSNKDYFEDYDKIVITSGKGCGDAVLSALDELPLIKGDKCFIQWGDSYCNFEVVKRTFMQGMTSDCVVIPCETVDNPYVQLEQFGDRISVKFSKYDEITNKGFHDLSLFFGDACYIKDCLEEYKRQIFKSGNYIHKHGNEMEFLDLFNEVGMKGTIIPITYHSCFSFNKMSEFKDSTCILNDDTL